ncbi:hypothetical protein BYT27DRAFT_7277147 [Phlegmacium glaucopus]|nr:hypothetical protein BYT27DRAFT_7277147 [Phlegmacium glaucopus]
MDTKDEVEELTTKLHGLNMQEAAYASTYARLVLVAPVLADKIPPPAKWTAGATVTAAMGTPSHVHAYSPAAHHAHHTHRVYDKSCHFCKEENCRIGTCPTVVEYLQQGRVKRHPRGYYTYPDGGWIEAHPGGLKGAVDAAATAGLNIPLPNPKDLLPHMIPTALSSFVTVQEFKEEEEEGFVWGAITELEEKMNERNVAEGYAVTRAQERKREEGKTDRKEGNQKTETRKDAQTPAYRFESRILDPELPAQILQRVLDIQVPNIKVKDLLSLSGDLCKVMVETVRTQKLATTNAAMITVPEVPVEFTTPLREVDIILMGKKAEVGLLDDGSEIVVIRRDLCEELGVTVNRNRRMTMQVANNVKEGLKGCAEFLEIDVGGIKTYAHVFVVDSAPYRLLLGRPWQKGVKLGKIEKDNGEVDVVITDPLTRKGEWWYQRERGRRRN